MDKLAVLKRQGDAFRWGPWIMQQRWHDLLFAHWRVPVEALRRVVPPELEIDTCEGSAWIGVVVFRLSGVKLRWLPEVPAVASFPEVNVRTYVTYQGRPGVYFLSLDADNPLAIALARPWFRLNYYNASIELSSDGEEINFASRRIERHIPEARIDVSYKPSDTSEGWRPGSLERWLTDRYCYYTVLHGRVMRCDIQHKRWPLQRAEAAFCENSMAAAQGVPLPPEPPMLHYCPCIEAHIWPLRRVPAQVATVALGQRWSAARAQALPRHND